MRLDRISARRIDCVPVYGEIPANPGSRGSERSIGFPTRGRYLVVGTGITVPAGVEKYYLRVLKNVSKIKKQSTKLAYHP